MNFKAYTNGDIRADFRVNCKLTVKDIALLLLNDEDMEFCETVNAVYHTAMNKYDHPRKIRDGVARVILDMGLYHGLMRAGDKFGTVEEQKEWVDAVVEILEGTLEGTLSEAREAYRKYEANRES